MVLTVLPQDGTKRQSAPAPVFTQFCGFGETISTGIMRIVGPVGEAVHPLKQYLFEVCEPVKSFAARVGASRQTLYRIFTGAHRPKPPLARRIVEATGGSVTFETLYGRREDRADIVLLKSPRRINEELDATRLAVALAIVCNHLTPDGSRGPPDGAYAIAAEAVVNTYTALSAVTTRHGPDRLRQALRPVIEEILTEYLGSAQPQQVLDQGAALSAELYFRTTSDLAG